MDGEVGGHVLTQLLSSRAVLPLSAIHGSVFDGFDFEDPHDFDCHILKT